MGATDHFDAGGRMPSFQYWQESKHLWAPRWQEVAGDRADLLPASPPAAAAESSALGSGGAKGARSRPIRSRPGWVQWLSVVTGLVAIGFYVWALGLAWQGTHTMADRWLGELSQTAGRPLP